MQLAEINESLRVKNNFEFKKIVFLNQYYFVMKF